MVRIEVRAVHQERSADATLVPTAVARLTLEGNDPCSERYFADEDGSGRIDLFEFMRMAGLAPKPSPTLFHASQNTVQV